MDSGWFGVLSHSGLDFRGNVRGLAFFYPHPTDSDGPIGIETTTRALPMTLYIMLLEATQSQLFLVLPGWPASGTHVKHLLVP